MSLKDIWLFSITEILQLPLIWPFINLYTSHLRSWLWISGACAGGEREGGAGNAEATNGAAGEQLQGVGALAWPVQQEITGGSVLPSDKDLISENRSC